MSGPGMTSIVKDTTRLVAGFIAVFAAYIALTGHLGPGGGFAGGVILAAAGVLVVLAFGARGAGAPKGDGPRLGTPADQPTLIGETRCHVADAVGAIGFLAIAMLGYTVGAFFVNFLPAGRVGHLLSGGMIPLANFAILLKVGAGLAGAFLALAVFRVKVEGGSLTWDSPSTF